MPKPVLQAMVLADHIYRDADTGKFLIIGTFGNFFVRPAPQQPPAEPDPDIEGKQRTAAPADVSQAGSPYLYLALTGIHGKQALQLQFVALGDSSVSLKGEIEVESGDPLLLVEFSVPLPPLLPLIKKPGAYSLDLLHEGEILGSWRVSFSVQQPTEETE